MDERILKAIQLALEIDGKELKNVERKPLS